MDHAPSIGVTSLVLSSQVIFEVGMTAFSVFVVPVLLGLGDFSSAVVKCRLGMSAFVVVKLFLMVGDIPILVVIIGSTVLPFIIEVLRLCHFPVLEVLLMRLLLGIRIEVLYFVRVPFFVGRVVVLGFRFSPVFVVMMREELLPATVYLGKVSLLAVIMRRISNDFAVLYVRVRPVKFDFVNSLFLLFI